MAALRCRRRDALDGLVLAAFAGMPGFEQPQPAGQRHQDAEAREERPVAGKEGRAPVVADGHVVELRAAGENGAGLLIDQLSEDAAIGGDEAAMAVVARAQERPAVLDGAEDHVAEVLLGAAALVVPRVVGDSHEHICAAAGELAAEIGKDVLKADIDAGFGAAGELEDVVGQAGREIAAHADEVAQPGQLVAEGRELAERHAMDLVVVLGNDVGWRQEKGAVEKQRILFVQGIFSKLSS